MTAQLSIANLHLGFGGIEVLHDVGFQVEPNTIVGLVGPNGAGKTSLFNCVSGHYRPTSGVIEISGTTATGKAATRLARHGLARTFQHPALQLQATVLENVLLGGHRRLPGGPAAWAFRLPYVVRAEHDLRDEALALLAEHDLAAAAHTRADELSHGLHKAIELCRALLAKPSILLLDEPAAGLSHGEVERLVGTVRRLRDDEGLTVVIVEHNMSVISQLTDKVIVLDHGQVLMEGTAAEAQSDPRVVEAYLGQPAAVDGGGAA